MLPPAGTRQKKLLTCKRNSNSWSVASLNFEYIELIDEHSSECLYRKKTNYILACFNMSKKKRKKKVKPFKNPNSSLFQNKTSGIHHSNYHKIV